MSSLVVDAQAADLVTRTALARLRKRARGEIPLPTLEIPAPHMGQQRVLDGARRFNVVDCGRRWGKTLMGEGRLIETALEGAPAAWFSPTYKMLAEVQRDFHNVLQPVMTRSNKSEHRFELNTGGIIEMWSLDNPDVARGRKYKRVVIDEAAMIQPLQDAWEKVIRPTLIDYKGDAWFLSTPKGINYFKVLYDRGQDPEASDWASWQSPTIDNPYISEAEVESMRIDMPEMAYQQEVLAKFIDAEGAVFRRIGQAATAEELEKGAERVQYVYGVDWAQSNDFTVITVMDPIRRAMVAMDRFNQIDYVLQAERLKALTKRFPPAVIVAESNAIGRPIIQRLQLEGLPIEAFETTAASKPILIQTLALGLERGMLTILNNPVLVGELQAFQAERMPSGRLRYEAPSGGHDDCVISLALAWIAIGDETPPDGRVIYDQRVSISPV